MISRQKRGRLALRRLQGAGGGLDITGGIAGRLGEPRRQVVPLEVHCRRGSGRSGGPRRRGRHRDVIGCARAGDPCLI